MDLKMKKKHVKNMFSEKTRIFDKLKKKNEQLYNEKASQPFSLQFIIYLSANSLQFLYSAPLCFLTDDTTTNKQTNEQKYIFNSINLTA